MKQHTSLSEKCQRFKPEVIKIEYMSVWKTQKQALDNFTTLKLRTLRINVYSYNKYFVHSSIRIDFEIRCLAIGCISEMSKKNAVVGYLALFDLIIKV